METKELTISRAVGMRPLHAYSLTYVPVSDRQTGCPTCTAPLLVRQNEQMRIVCSYECGSVYRWQAQVGYREWEVTLLCLGDLCGWTYEGDGDAPPNPV